MCSWTPQLLQLFILHQSWPFVFCFFFSKVLFCCCYHILFFLFLINLFIYFMAMLGLRFCARAFSSCGKWGPLFIAVRGPLTIAASLAAEHRLQTGRLSNCGSRAQLLRGMWDLPRPGLEPICPALAGGFSTTAPPGKPCVFEYCGHLTSKIAHIVAFFFSCIHVSLFFYFL